MNRRSFFTKTISGVLLAPLFKPLEGLIPIPIPKLKAVWTAECMQDLIAMHGIEDFELIGFDYVYNPDPLYKMKESV
mgnify:CR=1 FL=1